MPTEFADFDKCSRTAGFSTTMARTVFSSMNEEERAMAVCDPPNRKAFSDALAAMEERTKGVVRSDKTDEATEDSGEGAGESQADQSGQADEGDQGSET